MSSPTPPANGDTVALIGRITTTILAKGEVANVIWSPFYTQYVATGYAAVYSGPITPTPVFRSFSDAAVADLIGSPTAATRLALDALFGGGGGGPVSNEAVAAIVAATGATKTALDSRYAPVSVATTAANAATAASAASSAAASAVTAVASKVGVVEAAERAVVNAEAAAGVARLQSIFLGRPSGVALRAAKPTASRTATTLAAASAIGATTLSLAAQLTPGKYLVDTETVTITAVTGSSNPFTATLAAPSTAAHSSAAPIATTDLDYFFVHGIGGGRYVEWALPYRTNLPPAYSYGANQLGQCRVCLALLSVAYADSSFAFAGTWSGGTAQLLAYGGFYRYSTAAGATVTWTAPAGSTSIGWRSIKTTSGGLSKIAVSGDATLANMLPTAQQLVDAGRYAPSILVANGGTLNPTDRVLDQYASSLNYDVPMTLGANLTPAAHPVVMTSTGYGPVAATLTSTVASGVTSIPLSALVTAGQYLIGSETVTVSSVTGSSAPFTANLSAATTAAHTSGDTVSRTAGRTNISGFASGTASTLVTDAGAALFLLESVHDETGTTSAYEFADEVRPQGVGTLTLVGSVHGYERQTSLVVTAGDASVASVMAAGDLLVPAAGGFLKVVRTSTVYHPDTPTTPVFTVTVTYILDRYGLQVSIKTDYPIALDCDLAYTMLPANGSLSTVNKFDRAALSNFPGILSLPGSVDARYGNSKSAAAWMWSSVGKVAALAWLPDVYGAMDNWQYASPGLAAIQDRTGTLTKVYFSWISTRGGAKVIPAGSSKVRTVRYLVGYFPAGADVALANA
ncbi:hypothetical protein CH302_19335 [Rhodococcus sp. 15-2388-1-1a]|uniref:hypothetical protein n=1 Tax=Nocardiaceae TaxID=85025 RepID=UPI0005685E67|nr:MULTISPECIES: hypothetical protein [Rhodococcus]OZE95095.1 hypothetical protein CH302_19335 [Rhodococcus sp. 15-2388-1-1a]